MPTGDRAEDLTKAMVCYDRALEVFTLTTFPSEYAIVSENLQGAERELAEIQGEPP